MSDRKAFIDTVFIGQEWTHKPTGERCVVRQILRKDKMVLLVWVSGEDTGRQEYKRVMLFQKYYEPKVMYV